MSFLGWLIGVSDQEDRYAELNPQVEAGMDNPDSVNDQNWRSNMEESVDLFYEIREAKQSFVRSLLGF
jgi:hypothetical protein